MLEEMRKLSRKYNINRFSFLDSDTIGKDISLFENFIDLLIKVKKENDEHYEITHAEINPKNFDSYLIKKMILAEFKSVQIGYEAVTDNLLKKMDKRNSFSDNLLFVKFAIKYGLKVIGANIITGILSETDKDIYESIENLHFLRFYLRKNIFELKEILIELCKGSKFYKELPQDQLENWNLNKIYRLLPRGFLDSNYRFDLFGFYNKMKTNKLWDDFIDLDDHYTKANYTYSLIRENDMIFYKELCDNSVIKEFMFNEPEYWDVLVLANEKIISLDNLLNKLKHKYDDINKERINQIVMELKSEYLLYCNKEKSEIISVVNTTELIE